VARRQNKDGCVLDHGVLERDARTPFGSMTRFICQRLLTALIQKKPGGVAHCPNLTTVVGEAALGAGHDLERIGSETVVSFGCTPNEPLRNWFNNSV
jgi:hypothetical protein